jgi:hypothetical protein
MSSNVIPPRYPGGKGLKHGRVPRISRVAPSRKGYEPSMYIGIGTVVLIIIIILVIMFLRRA